MKSRLLTIWTTLILVIYNMDNNDILKRWRLILGRDAEKTMNNMCGMPALSAEELLLDSALSQIYG